MSGEDFRQMRIVSKMIACFFVAFLKASDGVFDFPKIAFFTMSIGVKWSSVQSRSLNLAILKHVMHSAVASVQKRNGGCCPRRDLNARVFLKPNEVIP